MSLTSMIDNQKEFQQILREHLPKKPDFATNKDVPAFSQKYTELVQNTFSNTWYSSVSGTMFDYMMRFIIANKMRNRDVTESLIAQRGLERLRIYCYSDEALWTSFNKKFKDCIVNVNRYIDSSAQDEFCKIIPDTYYLTKLEMFFRSGGYPPKDGIESLLWEAPFEIISDVDRLCREAYKVFIEQELVRKDSLIFFNPTFGLFSRVCGGADADIYIDGTLYDFKTSKRKGYNWKDVAQIYAYYLLDALAKIAQDNESTIVAYPIKKIAFYRARFGIVESLAISNRQGDELLDTLLKLNNYLQEIAKNRSLQREEQELFRNLNEESITKWVGRPYQT